MEHTPLGEQINKVLTAADDERIDALKEIALKAGVLGAEEVRNAVVESVEEAFNKVFDTFGDDVTCTFDSYGLTPRLSTWAMDREKDPYLELSLSFDIRGIEYETLIGLDENITPNYDCSSIHWKEDLDDREFNVLLPGYGLMPVTLDASVNARATIPKEEQEILIGLGKIKINYVAMKSAVCEF